MRTHIFRFVSILTLLVVGAFAGHAVSGAGQQIPQASASQPAAIQPAASAQDPLIFSYTAAFTCQEALQPGQLFYGVTPPLVSEKTEVTIRNPNAFDVVFYKQAVIARLESAAPVTPGAWVAVKVYPGHAIRINCDDIAILLTGNPFATFLGTYGIGVEVSGTVTIALGPQTVAEKVTPASLEVSAATTHRFEFLKKDVSFQAWWRWWWWPLPWRLAYPYERIVSISPSVTAVNVDCRDHLAEILISDVVSTMTDPERVAQTVAALQNGAAMDATNVANRSAEDPPALVPLIGRCEKLITAQGSVQAVIDYVLVSNKSPTDPNPITGTGSPIFYPWIPGRWYDLTVVVPQNVSVDLDDYIQKWHAQRWVDSGAPQAAVQSAMPYFFPWWCGVQSWQGWGGMQDCVDIAVGNSDSVDVIQVTPSRIFMPTWPPK